MNSSKSGKLTFAFHAKTVEHTRIHQCEALVGRHVDPRREVIVVRNVHDSDAPVASARNVAHDVNVDFAPAAPSADHEVILAEARTKRRHA
jgi:hypothetical protein